jgi:hypothetical protein
MAKHELKPPPAAVANRDSVEILRCWIVGHDSLHCSINALAWEDPRVWGVALADVARRVAQAIAAARGAARAETLAAVWETFNAEMNSPTDEPTGGFIE